MSELLNQISNQISVVKDFPKKDIYFRNISPLLGHHKLFTATIKLMAQLVRESKLEFDYIAGMESRGFLFIQLASELGCGFVMLRKPGKLPNTISFTYQKEYGTDSLTIEKDVIPSGSKVLVVDDLVATGGTIYAAHELIRKIGSQVTGAILLIELLGLKMNEQLMSFNLPILSLLKYPFNTESKDLHSED